MSDEFEFDEDEITSSILAILHGIDQPKGKNEWTNSPALLEPEDKSNINKNSADAPVKSINSKTLPTSMSSSFKSQPVEDSDLMPTESTTLSAQTTQSRRSVSNVPPAYSLLAQVSDSLPALKTPPSIPASTEASNPTPPVSNVPPASLPLAKALESPPGSNGLLVSSPPIQAAIDPLPVSSLLLPSQTLASPQVLDVPPAHNQSLSPVPEIASSPVQVSDSLPALKTPSVISAPAQAVGPLPVSNVLPVSSLPSTNTLESPPVSNVSPVTSSLPPAEAPKSPPVSNVSPVSSPLASDSPVIPNVVPIRTPSQAAESLPVSEMPSLSSPSTKDSELLPVSNSPPVSLPSAKLLESPQVTNVPPVQASGTQPVPNVLPVTSSLPPAEASESPLVSNAPPVSSPLASDSPVIPNALTTCSPPKVSDSPPVSSLPSQALQSPDVPPAQSSPPVPKVPPIASSPFHVSDVPKVSNLPSVSLPSAQDQASDTLPVPNLSSLVNSSSAQASNLPSAEASDIPPVPNVPPANLPLSPSAPPLDVLIANSPAASNISPVNYTPSVQNNYYPAGPHFNSSPVGASNVPQSGYDPVGPALSAQVGNKSFEMAEKFRNLARTQSTISSLDMQLQNMGMAQPMHTDFTLTNYLQNPTNYISAEDYKDAGDTVLDEILTVTKQNSIFDAISCSCMRKKGKEKKSGHKTTMAIHIIRFWYFAFQFVYPLLLYVIRPSDRPPVAFIVVSTAFALVGIVYDGIQAGRSIVRHFRQRNERKKEEEQKKLCNNDVLMDNNPQLEGVHEQKKSSTGRRTTTPRKILFKLAIDMFEEILIYPSLICNLYGIINDKVWTFETKKTDYGDAILTLSSFFVDVLFAKLNHIWLLHQLMLSAKTAQKRNNIYSRVSPINLFVPFSIGVTIAHILMLALIGIRIYADNFNDDAEKECKKEMIKECENIDCIKKLKYEGIDEGCYYVNPYTMFMIFCGAYLPIMSAACFIILNKYWFLQISWILHNEKTAIQKMNYLHIFYMPTRIKLFGFLRDKYTYIAVGVFGPAFIAFYAGAFLVDYDSDELPKGAQLASYVVGGPFVLLFSMINLQATITFIALVALFMIIICIVCIGGGSPEKLRDKFVRPAS